MRRLERDDAVITPSGKRARVIGIEADGFCNLRYLQADAIGRHQETWLHEKLLRLIKPGREAPPPVRVDATGRRN